MRDSPTLRSFLRLCDGGEMMNARMFRRIVSTVAVMSAVSMLTGTAYAAEKKKIALVQINQEALFFTQMDDGAQKAAKAAGADLTIFNSNNDPSAQNNAIETYIQQKVDALLVVAIDVNGIKPAITEAKKAGIPVVTIDAIVNGDNDVQVGVDNLKVGKDIGTYTANYIKKSLKGKADVGVVGALNSYIQNVRLDGFKAGLAAAPGAKLGTTVDGQNVQDQAQTAAENLISGNPDMQVVVRDGRTCVDRPGRGGVGAERDGSRQDFRLGPKRPGNQRHRSGFRDGSRPAGPGRRGQGRRQCRAEADCEAAGREEHLGTGDHRNEGERREVPQRLQVSGSSR
jgi:ribose transport system substrate-binding protein